MNLESYLDHSRFYRRKYGNWGLIQAVASKWWTKAVGHWEWMYYISPSESSDTAGESQRMTALRAYSKSTEIEDRVLAQLRLHKSNIALERFLRRFFSRGATLWLAEHDGSLVCLFWTLRGGFNGFYSMPIAANDIIVLAVEVFPAYRGRGVFPQAARELFRECRAMRCGRVYFKVADRNWSMRRSMRKTGCVVLGKVFTISLRSWSVTLWRTAGVQSNAVDGGRAQGATK